jgi:hypothetical protein
MRCAHAEKNIRSQCVPSTHDRSPNRQPREIVMPVQYAGHTAATGVEEN